MLRPELRDFKGRVGFVHDFLLHAVDFVSENEGVARACCRLELLQLHGVLSLFDAENGVAVGAEAPDGLQRVRAMFPRHAVLGAERRFVDFCGRRGGGDAAKVYLVNLEGVGTAEGAADIVRAAHVVKHHDHSGRG